jgi:Zn-dependent protease with chaperone function
MNIPATPLVTGGPGFIGRHLPLLPYQRRIVEFLKRTEPEAWRWLSPRSGARDRDKYENDLRFELLKTAYRIERHAAGAMYDLADEAALRLGVSAPITLYQAQHPQGLNASLAYLEGEAHIVLAGPIGEQLTAAELHALFGHELAHFALWSERDGDLLVARDLLSALAQDERAHPAQLASLRLLVLYDEIYCDRGAYAVAGDLLSVVSLLIKLRTGVREVSAESYLRQADEIFSRAASTAQGETHPEPFIRARALRLWAEEGEACDGEIERMIESAADLKSLDLLGQERVAGWTRRVVNRLLARKWFQSELALAHAKLFFSDYSPPENGADDCSLPAELATSSASLRDYFCYVLLDFVAADRELDEPALAAAIDVAEWLTVDERFLQIARDELRLRKNQLDRVVKKKDEILRKADLNRE